MFEVLALFLRRGKLCKEGVHVGASGCRVSILVISYGALGLLHLVNADFSSPNAVLDICLELFSVPKNPVVVIVTVIRLEMECLPGTRDTGAPAFGLYMKQVLTHTPMESKGCPPSV